MDKTNTCPSHQEIKGKVVCLSVPPLIKQKYLNLGSIAFSPGISNDPIPPQATELVTKPAQCPDLDYGYSRWEAQDRSPCGQGKFWKGKKIMSCSKKAKSWYRSDKLKTKNKGFEGFK